MNNGLYALAGDSATATAAACAKRFDDPMTKVSNMYFGFSRLPSGVAAGVRRSSRPVPAPDRGGGTGAESGIAGGRYLGLPYPSTDATVPAAPSPAVVPGSLAPCDPPESTVAARSTGCSATALPLRPVSQPS